jgi:hypothetical protein
MVHRTPPQRNGLGLRVLLSGRRTRVVVALIGLLVSLSVPVATLVNLVPAVQRLSPQRPDDPAGLGVTGALPGDPGTGVDMPPLGMPPIGVADALPGVAPAPVLPGIPTPPNLPDGPLGIPGIVLDAYQFAQRTLAELRPGCHLTWPVLAGIGRIESNHASGGRVDRFGNTLGPILGPALDGSPGMAAIPDTDHGVLDTDPVWDRAVGPMQFIPSSWRSYAVDGNGDGVADPNNIYDATVSAALYLCAGGANLADPAQLQAAVFRYNHSATYVSLVLGWAQAYLSGVAPIPSAPGPVPAGINGNGGRPLPAGPPAGAAAAAATKVAAVAAAPTPSSTSPPPAPATTSALPPPPPSPTTPPPPAETTTSAPPPPPVTSEPPPSLTATTTPPPPPTTTTNAPPPPPPQ